MKAILFKVMQKTYHAFKNKVWYLKVQQQIFWGHCSSGKEVSAHPIVLSLILWRVSSTYIFHVRACEKYKILKLVLQVTQIIQPSLYVGWGQEWTSFYSELYSIYSLKQALRWQIQLDKLRWSNAIDIIRMVRLIAAEYLSCNLL